MKKTREEMMEGESGLAAAFDMLPCGVALLSERENVPILSLNRAGRAILEKLSFGSSLLYFRDFIHESDWERFQETLRERRQETAEFRLWNGMQIFFRSAFVFCAVPERKGCCCAVFVLLEPIDDAARFAELPYIDWKLAACSVRYSAAWRRKMQVEFYSPYGHVERTRDAAGLAPLFRRPRESDGILYPLRRLDGSVIWCKVRSKLFFDAAGALTRVFFSFVDITQEKIVEQRLRKKTEHDALTRLYSKVAAERKIRARMKAGIGCLQALMFIDIDNFKTVNDTLGHWQGDVVLRAFSERLRRFFTSRDIVGRVGGDEFLVFLQGKSAALAEKKARRLLAAMREICAVHAPQCPLSASVGIVSFVMDQHSFAAIYQAADRALYEAKRGGKADYFHRRLD